MEAVNTIGVVGRLVTGAGQAAQLATDVYRSFRDAPIQLSQLATKLTLLKCRIQQIRKFGDELSNSDMEDLFPEEHRTLLMAVLEPTMASLQDLRCLQPATKVSESFKSKLSWALLDKKRVGRIVKDLNENNILLSQCLDIFSARLDVLNHTSIGALRAGQSAIQATSLMLQTSVLDIQQTQEQTIMRMNGAVGATETTNHLLQEILAEQRNFMAEQRAATGLISSFIATQNNSLPIMERILHHVQSFMLYGRGAYPDDDHSILKHRPFNFSNQELIRPMNSLITARNKGSRMTEWTAGELPLSYSSSAMMFHIPDSRSMMLSPGATKLRLIHTARGKRKDFHVMGYMNIFGSVVLQAELSIRLVAKSWFNLPWMNLSLKGFNIRPFDSLIFEAIEDLNLPVVRGLIEGGEASIHDVSSYEGQTLVGALVDSSTSYYSSDHPVSVSRRQAAEDLLSYLLREGCDPNIMSQTSQHRPSNMAWAMSLSGTSIPKILYDHGADPDWSPMSRYLYRLDKETVTIQNKMLHSWGVLRWDTYDSIVANWQALELCCSTGDAELMIRFIEEGKLDINTTAAGFRPIHVALENGSLELAAVLIAYGAKLGELAEGDDISRCSSMYHTLKHENTSVNAHFLLLHGADPGATWDNSLGWVFGNNSSTALHRFSFDEAVGMGAHMLLHGANCHFLADDRSPIHRPYPGPQSAKYRQSCMNETYPTADLNTPPQRKTIWTTKGVICLDDFDDIDNLYDNWRAKKASRVDSGFFDNNDENSRTSMGEQDLDATDDCSDTDSDYDREIEHEEFRELKRKHISSPFLKPAQPDNLSSEAHIASYGRMGFRDIVSTRKGRRRLARYPRATAYCAAVQLAGYRAEMDDDGDVWWSDDDGDPYVDASEDRPLGGDEDDGKAVSCLFCQDPEGWGLGMFTKRRDEGLQLVRKYKEQNKRAGDRYRKWIAEVGYT
ncbi:hypothetical protein PT974_02841 [Cladobotryum mycophilum]|uniref:Fungal N-terminal domain-containing protein n=1 Tax=Cladobotryum mycophilum TaxID=491253 RepID=A0ABR0SZ66_9HYPO